MPTEKIQRQDARTLENMGKSKVEAKFKTLEALKIEYVAPDSIFPNAYNPNRQSEREFELLVLSMKEDGFTQPVVVQLKSREIVDGEHRWRAAQHLGLKEIPVVFVDMTPEQQRISTLRHNRARGSEDVELTIKILHDLRELGALEHAVDSLQISDRELNALMDDLPAPEVHAAEKFSDSWLPAPPDLTDLRINMNNHIEASTQRAQDIVKKINNATKEAGSETEYQMLAQKSGRFETMLAQFTRDEIKETLDVLGKAPAKALLTLTLYYMNKNGMEVYPLE